MTKEDSEIIIRQSEKDGSLTWSNEAVKRVWQWTQGHPYLTQLLCSEIWETVVEGHEPPTVNIKDVDAAINTALEQGANAFQWIWTGLPPAERVVLAAMAEAKGKPISQDELTEILNRSRIQLVLREVELAPETLIRWNLLRQVDNTFRVTIPLLRRWVAAENPLHRVKADLDRMEPLAEFLYNRGEGFYKIGNLDEAERSLRNALNVNPNHLRTRLLLGQVLLGKGGPAAAIEVLEPAYAFDPDAAKSGLIRALLALAETQNEEDQLVTYDRILAIDPGQVMASEKKQAVLRKLQKKGE
jgi:tetratricopeptide (TPR) repeat protein